MFHYSVVISISVDLVDLEDNQ